jgi:hypothetical protein
MAVMRHFYSGNKMGATEYRVSLSVIDGKICAVFSNLFQDDRKQQHSR